MSCSLICLYVVTIVLPMDAIFLTRTHDEFADYKKNLYGLHLQFHQSAKANGYLLTETHFRTKVRTICTNSGCSSSAKEKECPKDWKSFGENCYMLLSKNRNRDSAQRACESLNADLADITSKNENTWVHKTFGGFKGHAWIGATDKNKEGEWRWSPSGKLMAYSAWRQGQPDNYSGNDNCAVAYMFRGEFIWGDVPCGSNFEACLCKKNKS